MVSISYCCMWIFLASCPASQHVRVIFQMFVTMKNVRQTVTWENTYEQSILGNILRNIGKWLGFSSTLSYNGILRKSDHSAKIFWESVCFCTSLHHIGKYEGSIVTTSLGNFWHQSSKQKEEAFFGLLMTSWMQHDWKIKLHSQLLRLHRKLQCFSIYTLC